ncbi:MAG TPA: YadA-like family protein, partial [Lysobacter sp.]
MGTQAQVNAEQGVALGAGAQSNHALSVALGSASQTSVGAQTGYTAFGLAAPQDSAGEVSIGSAGSERKLTHLAAGSDDTDAVNVAQLRAVQITANDALPWDASANGGAGAFSANHLGVGPNKIVNVANGEIATGSLDSINGGQVHAGLQQLATHFGGNAAVGGGGLVGAPSYELGGNVFNDVGSALAALNGRLASLEASTGGGVADGRFTAQAAAPASATGTSSVAAGSNAQASANNSVALGANSVADRADTVSVGARGAERQVVNVADGTAATDAVNVQQMQAQSATTLTQANVYTDQRVSEIVAVPMQAIEDLRGQVDDQFRHTDRRINRQGAMNAAMVHMASSAANIQTRNRVSVGAGYAEGQEALAVGYQRQLKPNVSFSLGAAFSGSEQSAGAGIGVGW